MSGLVEQRQRLGCSLQVVPVEMTYRDAIDYPVPIDEGEVIPSLRPINHQLLLARGVQDKVASKHFCVCVYEPASSRVVGWIPDHKHQSLSATAANWQ